MNKDQRKELQLAKKLIEEANEKLETAKGIIEIVAEEEQEKFDNLNEGMQAMERNQKLEDNADTLQSAVEQVDDAMNCLTEAIQSIEEI